MTRGPFYQKLPVTDRSWMLILLGRGFPLFLFLFFSFFFSSGSVRRAQRKPLFLQEVVPLCPLPVTLTQSPPAKPNPLAQPSQAFVHLCEMFWGPLPPPCCRMSVGHDAQDAAGRRAPASPLHCPHHGDAAALQPISSLGMPFLHVGLASAPLLAGSLPPKLGSWGFGVALANAPPKQEEGRCPLGCHRLLAGAVPRTVPAQAGG